MDNLKNETPLEFREEECRLSKPAKSLWAKSDSELGEGWLPLYVHLYDTALIMAKLWEEWLSRNTRKLIATCCCGKEELARKSLVFLASIHDIGKATPIFQAKPCYCQHNGEITSLSWKPEKAGLFINALLSSKRHPTHPLAGQVLVDRYLQDGHGWSYERSDAWGSIVGAHHGNVPDKERLHEAFNARDEIGFTQDEVGRAWCQVQRELLGYAFRLSGLTSEDMKALAECTWNVPTESVACGLLIMADWIASNQDLFPLLPLVPGDLPGTSDAYACGDMSLRGRAERAWRKLALPGAWIGEAPSDTDAWFRNRFGLSDNAELRPVQHIAIDVAKHMDNPSLMVIEAPMGEGKTEAALAAAEIVGTRFGCGGVCVALPTMATTDAMFGRVHRWLESLLGHGRSSIYLAHGKARLNEEYQGIIRASRSKRFLSSMGQDLEDTDGPDERVVVSDWMQGRKKGMLASFVVCTVDQVLMGSLEMRHLALRQLALAGKVVIIDECHAYDSYMQQYLCRVLEWLGAWGCPVILLSATLPTAMRDDFTEAYRAGRESQTASAKKMTDGASVLGSLPRGGRSRAARSRARETSAQVSVPLDPARLDSYPLVTLTTKEGVRKSDCPPSSRTTKISVAMMGDDEEELVSLLESELRDGGVAGVICDTVSRAQDVYRALRAKFSEREVVLVHARFIDLDRMANETRLRDMLGPDASRSNGRRPERMIVVGTQVLEQSLDIDFDLLVTDLAPIDLIMQRIGRVHRHARGEGERDRPARLRHAYCYIRGIKEFGVEGPSFAPGITKVYEVASLMEALAVSGLCDASGSAVFSLPQDVARLVRCAYDSSIASHVPKGWRSAYATACDNRAKATQDKRVRAETFLLPSVRNAGASGGTLTNLYGRAFENESKRRSNEDAGQRAVRDAQETIEVLLVCRRGESICLLPWVGDEKNGVELGQEIPTSYVPDRAVAMVVAQCSVRLPALLCLPWQIDQLIEELERGCEQWVMTWQENPMLAGSLALALEEVESEPGAFEGKLLGYRVRYTRAEGLSAARRI